MLSTAKFYLSSIAPSVFRTRKESKKKGKPPAHRRNKHLRRKKPGIFSSARDFISSRVGWKGLASAFMVLACIFVTICNIAYAYSPIEPLDIDDFEIEEPAWTHQPYEVNRALQTARRIRSVRKIWPTAIDSDKNDNLFVATSAGTILQISRSKEGLMGEGEVKIIRQGPLKNITLDPEHVGNFMGRPVALRYVQGTGLLFVLDVAYGLYIVSTESKISSSLFSISSNGTGVRVPTSFALSEQGTEVYITDFSTKWSDYYLMYQLMEGNCTGRLWKYDFSNNDMKVLVNDLCAPTGVEITSNDTTLLVTEGQFPRIRSINLNTTESKFIKLPGFPGKPKRNPRGGCWVPITVANRGFFDRVNPSKWLRKLLGGLLPPSYLWSLATKRHTILVETDPSGNVVDSLHDDTEKKVFEVAEVKEGRRGQLIIASPVVEHLTKLVSPENLDEKKAPVMKNADAEDDEFGRLLRQQREEMEKEFHFDPEPGGFVNEKLVGEGHMSFKDEPRYVATGWFDKTKPDTTGADNKQASSDKKEL